MGPSIQMIWASQPGVRTHFAQASGTDTHILHVLTKALCAYIFQKYIQQERCMRQTRASGLSAHILRLPSNAVHTCITLCAPMRMMHACISSQEQLQLGVLLPHGQVNIPCLHIMHILQDEASEEDVSQSRLVQ